MKSVRQVAKVAGKHPNRVRELCREHDVKKDQVGAYTMTEAQAKRIAKQLSQK